jgi:hypothetical protein
MPERRGRKLLFGFHAMLAVLMLIVGGVLAIETASGGWGLALAVALAMGNWVAFVLLAILFGATAMHLRPERDDRNVRYRGPQG